MGGKKAAATQKDKYGDDWFARIARNVKNRPTKFNSNSGRAAALKRWEKVDNLNAKRTIKEKGGINGTR